MLANLLTKSLQSPGTSLSRFMKDIFYLVPLLDARVWVKPIFMVFCASLKKEILRINRKMFSVLSATFHFLTLPGRQLKSLFSKETQNFTQSLFKCILLRRKELLILFRVPLLNSVNEDRRLLICPNRTCELRDNSFALYVFRSTRGSK